MVKAIQTHSLKTPTFSLGVATFSTAQRDAILDELELARHTDSVLDAFIASDSHEPFFVKNLESVQGDERDVIFISVGYGRDASGYMSTNFGPVNGIHGARRLNVLFSRAKYRCEVFSSITDEDIDIRGESGTRGVLALKSYLRFARTGLLDTPRATGREEDSPFETSVRHAIEAMGYVVDTQVGQSGFFIDLAVIDPTCPGRYLLGVECDGASYHSSRFARERDRLRQAVLESQGWDIHRIWSTDWFKQPENAKEKLRCKIETLRAKVISETAAAKTNDESTSAPDAEHIAEGSSRFGVMQQGTQSSATERTPVTRAAPEDDQDGGHIGTLATPYKQAAGDAFLGADPVASITAILTRVLTCETPIHKDELERRCRDFFGLARFSGAFEQQVTNALRSLVRAKDVIRRGDFYFLPHTQIVPRNRSEAASESLRKPMMIAAEEYDEAIRVLLHYCHGANTNDVAIGIAKMFGFKTASTQLRECAMKSLDRLIKRGEVQTDTDGINQLTAKGAQ